MPELPELIYNGLQHGKHLQRSVDKIASELQTNHIRQGQSRYLFAIGATLLLSGTLLLINRPDWGLHPLWLMAGGAAASAVGLAQNALTVTALARGRVYMQPSGIMYTGACF